MVKKMISKLVIKNATPHQVALGVAFGTLVALLPTFGFAAIITIALLPFLPNMNKPAIFLGIAFWNPFVQAPVYALSFELGTMLYTGSAFIPHDLGLVELLQTYTLRFLTGHVVLTLCITILSYLLVFFFSKFTFRKPNTEVVFSQ